MPVPHLSWQHCASIIYLGTAVHDCYLWPFYARSTYPTLPCACLIFPCDYHCSRKGPTVVQACSTWLINSGWDYPTFSRLSYYSCCYEHIRSTLYNTFSAFIVYVNILIHWLTCCCNHVSIKINPVTFKCIFICNICYLDVFLTWALSCRSTDGCMQIQCYTWRTVWIYSDFR